MPPIRLFLLSLPERLQISLIVGATVTSAFAAALAIQAIYSPKLLMADASMTSAIYEVFGTIYAVLLAFVVSGSWQNFSATVKSVHAEAAALSDLVHIIDGFPAERIQNIRRLTVAYINHVIGSEWQALARVARGELAIQDFDLHISEELIRAIQLLETSNPRETAMFEQALGILDKWLDARRERLQSVSGGGASALWPLLIAGALVLFAFHGLFAPQSHAVWVALLLGLSTVVGISFYLIFSLDSPFTGSLSAQVAPFIWVINWCQSDMPPAPGKPEAG